MTWHAGLHYVHHLAVLSAGLKFSQLWLWSVLGQSSWWWQRLVFCKSTDVSEELSISILRSNNVQQARITKNSNVICLLFAHFSDPEDGDYTSLRNFGKLLDYTVRQQKKLHLQCHRCFEISLRLAWNYGLIGLDTVKFGILNVAVAWFSFLILNLFESYRIEMSPPKPDVPVKILRGLPQSLHLNDGRVPQNGPRPLRCISLPSLHYIMWANDKRQLHVG